MATLARMQYNQRQTFQADSDDDDDAHNAPAPNNPDARYAAADPDDLLDAEEAEQERLMSERYGEAGEAPATAGEKRGAAAATDQDIAAELAGEARKIKKVRPTLQPANLIGSSNGLIRIKNEFNDMAKYRAVDRAKLLANGSRSAGNKRQQKKQKMTAKDQIRRAELNAAAAYSRDLMGAYRTYCHDLFPNMAFEDTIARIETLSSKKEVKDYAEIMREDVRRNHLEKIFGTEKTDRMLSELESTVVDGFGGMDDGMGVSGMGVGAVSNPYGGAGGDTSAAGGGAGGAADEEEREMEDEIEQQAPPTSPVRDYRGITRGSSQKSNPYAAGDSPGKGATSAADKEEEEVEATFDEEENEVAGNDKDTVMAPPADADDEAASDDAASDADKDKEASGNEEGEEKEEEEGEELEFVAQPEVNDVSSPATEKEDAGEATNKEDKDGTPMDSDADANEAAAEDMVVANTNDVADDDGNISKPAEDRADEEDGDDDEEQLFYDATQPSQGTTESPPEPLGQETPTPPDTASPEPSQEDYTQPDTEPETEAFGIVNMDMEEKETSIQKADECGEDEKYEEQLVVDATQETLTLVPTMTADDGEGDGVAMSQMSLEY